MSEMQTILKAESLGKAFQKGGDAIHVLQNLNMEIVEGETVAILGRSGAGKSTLLHILGGLGKPDQGQVFLQGQDIYAASARSMDKLRNETVGFVFQFHHLLREFTAQENVAMPLMIRGVSRRQALESAKEALERVGLADRLEHQSGELSGGEQQRVALARALVAKPRIILADEPTGNLDKRNAAEVEDLLLKLSQEDRVAVVVVTHNEEFANRLGRVVRLDEGKIYSMPTAVSG